MIREEIVHINGIPKKLVVFLHGYFDDADAIDNRLCDFAKHLPDCAIHIPQAPFMCEVDEHFRQWYSMYRFDPEYKRKTAPDMDKFVSYYNKMSLGLAETFNYLHPYLEQTLSEYSLGYEDLFLCGFSQGAMSAIYTALMLPQKIGGLVSLSGIIAGYEYLQKNAQSCPDTLLLHGTDDKLLRSESLAFTANKLRKIGCKVTSHNIKGGGHQVSPQSVSYVVKFIHNQIK